MSTVKREDHGRYLPDAVYGALDGIITTFAVVAGVAGASLSSTIILVLGFANLLADGVSMGVGAYLQKRSEEEYRKQLREEERKDIAANPQRHKEVIRQMYAQKGFSGRLLTSVVDKITRNEERWLDEIMIGERGVFQEDVNPVFSGITTFSGFVLIGLVPLLSYIVARFVPGVAEYTFVTACALTGITLFVVGSMRSLVIAQRWWKAGLEMLLTGSAAAVIAYGVGAALKGLV